MLLSVSAASWQLSSPDPCCTTSSLENYKNQAVSFHNAFSLSVLYVSLCCIEMTDACSCFAIAYRTGCLLCGVLSPRDLSEIGIRVQLTKRRQMTYPHSIIYITGS